MRSVAESTASLGEAARRGAGTEQDGQATLCSHCFMLRHSRNGPQVRH